MTVDPQTINGAYVDLSYRFAQSTTVVGSPALAAETIIGSLQIPGNLVITSGVLLGAWCGFTVGTSGTAVTLRVRETSLTGTTVVSSGALTSAAGNLNERSIYGFDTAATPNMTYKFTMQVTNGAAASTVSAVTFWALVI